MSNYNYNCNQCEQYDKLNGYCCRICGQSVQFEHKARQKINQTYTTDEKYCDFCGKKRHSGICKSNNDRKF